jgi:hypothetical protein
MKPQFKYIQLFGAYHVATLENEERGLAKKGKLTVLQGNPVVWWYDQDCILVRTLTYKLFGPSTACQAKVKA